jgi:hypothetical protein
MMTLKELSTQSFDAIHGIVVDHLIETHGECDHDKHGDLMVDIIYELKKRLQS